MAQVKRHPPLDTSHSPFKRMASFGPGPRASGHGDRYDGVRATGRYSCVKGRAIKEGGEITHYVQKCTDNVTGKVRKIKTDAAWKAEYNAAYNKKRTRSAASNTYRAGYKPPAGTQLYEAGQKSLAKKRK